MPIPADKTLEELFKFRLAQLRADSESATSNVSQVVRLVAYGLAALIIPLVTSEPNKIPPILQHHSSLIMFASMLGCTGIVFDILQNVLADRCARADLRNLASHLQNSGLIISSPADFMVSAGKPSQEREIRQQAYWAKLGIVVLGVGVFVIAILAEMISQ
jgi:hypothetical protein